MDRFIIAVHNATGDGKRGGERVEKIEKGRDNGKAPSNAVCLHNHKKNLGTYNSGYYIESERPEVTAKFSAQFL